MKGRERNERATVVMAVEKEMRRRNWRERMVGKRGSSATRAAAAAVVAV
jgi:hypothetical protein